MSAWKAVRSVLAGSTAVSALVGDRIQPGYLGDRGDYPAITYQEISRTNATSGSNGRNPVNKRVQVDCWAGTYAGLDTLVSAVLGALDGYTGTANGVVVRYTEVENALDVFEEEASDADRNVWRKIMDFRVHYDE